ncbi:hypothetical protein [Psychromonas ossibalaenae]|uniref:hypothetical protein n=1 Tax=Psychromonas ossibalaenae TaxID=444922 RepID=UPI0003641D7C|nr:hypothetical protein [Psychromonas ossibalaenae]
MNKIKLVSMLGAACILSACSAKTSFQAMDDKVELNVNKNEAISVIDNTSQSYSTTSFGQYVFKATSDGKEPMYGLMPLKFNGGYLAADILFFAPAMFFNLREVYPHYQFDVDAGVIRYKNKDKADWVTYTPTKSEVERAKKYFNSDIK